MGIPPLQFPVDSIEYTHFIDCPLRSQEDIPVTVSSQALDDQFRRQNFQNVTYRLDIVFLRHHFNPARFIKVSQDCAFQGKQRMDLDALDGKC